MRVGEEASTALGRHSRGWCACEPPPSTPRAFSGRPKVLDPTSKHPPTPFARWRRVAVTAGVREGGTALVVGDGSVGLCGVIAASQLCAEREIAMPRPESRQRVARRFGATDVVAERGEEGEAAVAEPTRGVGADAVLQFVGTGGAMRTAFTVAPPESTVGPVGVPHDVELPVRRMSVKNVGLVGARHKSAAVCPTCCSGCSP